MNISRLALVLIVGTVLVGSVIFLRSREQPAAKPVSGGRLGVDQLAKDPTAFADQVVTLEGVVAEIVPAQQMFTVIDRAEYQACKVVTCSQYQIPIAFVGQLPQAEQAVSITGRLTQPERGRFLLQASQVELLP